MKNLPLTFRQLQYALSVADFGGFRRAAQRCHVSQPTLSTQLAELEQALGVTLFERASSGVRPTRAGEALLPRIRHALLAVDELMQAARALEDPFEGELRIGVIPTVAAYVLPSFTPALCEAHPRLRVLWREDKTATLRAALEAGALDALIVALESDMGGLAYAELARDPFVLAGAPSHPLLQRCDPLAGLHALADETLYLLDEGHCFRDQARDLCSAVGAQEAGFRATSLATLVQIVLGAGGLTLLPALTLARENGGGQLAVRRFAEPAPARTLVLAYRPSAPFAEALAALAAIMRRAYPAEGLG